MFWNNIKLNSFVQLKKILITDKGIISKVYKTLIQFRILENDFKLAEMVFEHSFKEDSETDGLRASGKKCSSN